MSKIRIFLLTAIITGFAFFSPAKAAVFGVSGSTVNHPFNDTICLLDGDTLHLVSPNHTTEPGLKKKIVSALFALPFPCGFMGTHRVMLGTSPWVPVVYVATFGGCFGLLPLIDFCFIAFSKDITPYENNPHVFMWVK